MLPALSSALLPRMVCLVLCAPHAATSARHGEARPAHPILLPDSRGAARGHCRDATTRGLAAPRATPYQVARAKADRGLLPTYRRVSPFALLVPAACRFCHSSAAQAAQQLPVGVDQQCTSSLRRNFPLRDNVHPVWHAPFASLLCPDACLPAPRASPARARNSKECR